MGIGGKIAALALKALGLDGSRKPILDPGQWDDVANSLVAQRLESVVGKLRYNYDNNSITMQSGGLITNTNDRLIFNQQYPHAAEEDGEMRLHIHWEQVDSTSREFTIEYRTQINGEAKNTVWTQVIVDSNTNNVLPYVSGTINQITELVAVDMTGVGISATTQFRLARTDIVAGDIEATFVDSHIKRDMIGSRAEYVR